jgi:hypothetical protein
MKNLTKSEKYLAASLLVIVSMPVCVLLFGGVAVLVGPGIFAALYFVAMKTLTDEN